MKKIAWILSLALFGLMVSTVNTGCGDDPQPVPVDTSGSNNNTPKAEVFFTLNGEKRSVVVDTINSFCQYTSVDNRTNFLIKGRSTEKSEAIEIEISYTGKEAGTYSIASGGANIEIATGEGIRKIQYAPKPREEIEIVVSTYAEVGGRMIGTFSGELQSASLSTGTLTLGSFSIRRIEDN